jgi:hypothetical protein
MTAKELYDLICHRESVTYTDCDLISLCRLVMEQEQELEDIRNWIRQPRNCHENNPTV